MTHLEHQPGLKSSKSSDFGFNYNIQDDLNYKYTQNRKFLFTLKDSECDYIVYKVFLKITI